MASSFSRLALYSLVAFTNSSRSRTSSFCGAGTVFLVLFRCAALSAESTVSMIRINHICAFLGLTMLGLLHQTAGATPTRVNNEVSENAPAGGWRAFIVGPVDKHRTTDY